MQDQEVIEKGEEVKSKCSGGYDRSKPKGQRHIKCDAKVYRQKQFAGFYICSNGHQFGNI